MQSYECDTEDSCEAVETEQISHENGFSEENVPVFKSNFEADVLFKVIKYFYSII